MAAKKSLAKKPASKPTPKRASAASAKRSPAAPKQAAPKRHGPRADLGAPVDGFFAKQPPELRAILVKLREMIEKAVPRAESAIKWGMPFYSLDGQMLCALGAHKSHVNLILSGPPGTFEDPDGLLTGEGKTGRHLKLTRAEQIPVAEVKKWLKAAIDVAASR